jgi:predicted MFS family arabinose efflux permease
MKRFLMLVGVAVVAAAMYVAASPASQQSSGPTAKQFNALKKQVATLAKKLKTAQTDINTVAFAYVHCSLPSEIGVSQRGTSTSGYLFGTSAVNSPTTALDLVATNPTYVLTPYNTSDTGCQSLIGAAPLRHNAGSVIAHKLAR